LFGILFQKDKEGFIEYSLNQRNKESALPPNLPKEQFEQLPEALGIYIFYDQKGKIIYVGKANNIKNRVKTHFAQTTNTHAKAHFIKNIYKVDFEICESELIALLKEAHYIKKHWPPYNRTLKNISLNYGVYTYQDQAGYNRLAIAKAGKHDKPIVSYRYHYQARAALINLAKNHTLCP